MPGIICILGNKKESTARDKRVDHGTQIITIKARNTKRRKAPTIFNRY